MAIHGFHAATAAAVYKSVRKTSRGVEALLGASAALVGDMEPAKRLTDERLEQNALQRSDAAGSRSWAFDHIEAHINGFYGDYLAKQQNPLDLGMTLRIGGQVLALESESLDRAYPNVTGKLVIFVHGLCCTEWAWSIAADEQYGDPTVTFGTQLQD